MEEQNPWWKGREFVKEDPDLRKWHESRIRWIPRLCETVELKPFSLNFLFGPRQVGKTTLVKLIIEKILESQVDPRAVFYYRCDRLSDHGELYELIRSYLKFKRALGLKNAYIFLDEVTFPREWYRAIKYLIDAGELEGDVLFLTGSWSMFVRREVEAFPGRRGHGRNYNLNPLSFREFLKLRNPRVTVDEVSELDSEEIWRKCVSARGWLNEVNAAFQDYLKCGGYPLAVKSFLEEGRVSEEAKDAILASFLSDIAKLRRSEGVAKRVLKAVIEKLPSPVSLHGIAKEFEIGSHKTVFYYLDLFENMFILKNLFYVDPNKLIEVHRKQRKVHLTDPLLYTVFSEWCLTEVPRENALVESVVASHLARAFRVGYWRNKTEVDVVIPEKMLGFEVKWGTKVSGREKVLGRIKHVVTLTRDEFNEKPLAVPVSLFLAGFNA